LESDDYFPRWLLQIICQDCLFDFAAAFGVSILLLCVTSILVAGEQAIACMSQEDKNAVEENLSTRDKTILYLTEHLQLMRASCNLFHAVVLITVTVLCVFGLSVLSIASLSLTLLMAAITVIALWTVFYGIIPKLLTNYPVSVARITAPLLVIILKTGRIFLHLPTKHGESETHRKKQMPLVNDAPTDLTEKKEMLEEIILFYNKKANEIMTPRTDIVAIDIKSPLCDAIQAIVTTGYSRIPVYEDNEDHIKGILYAKDIIPLLNRSSSSSPSSLSSSDFQWQSFLRKPFFVPESKKIYDLLNELRANKTHLAIVVDEFGCTSGLVTMEDIIEEIVGDISDEYDSDELSYLALPDGSYLFEGAMQLNDFFRETGIAPSDFGDLTEEAETLTGLLLAIKGALPQKLENIEYKNYRFQILEADQRRIKKIEFSFIIQFLTLLLLSHACTYNYVPKPRGYLRIEPPVAHYVPFEEAGLPFTFEVSRQATIELPPADIVARWMNIDYPELRAKIYCNFHPITPETLRQHMEDCIKLVERAAEKADAIAEKAFENKENRLYGSLFLIEGESLSPIQFVLTDSISCFFRGALYYSFKPNTDSIAPVTAYIAKDITQLMQTFHWKK
jgi:gliding motility-associated lipoprotein GldD